MVVLAEVLALAVMAEAMAGRAGPMGTPVELVVQVVAAAVEQLPTTLAMVGPVVLEAAVGAARIVATTTSACMAHIPAAIIGAMTARLERVA